MALSEKTCVPCRGDVPALPSGEIEKLIRELNGWSVIRNHHLQKEYPFPDFKSAFAFVGKVAGIAEEQGHHPDIYLSWGKVSLEIWTHKIDGLTESDFILAAKCDAKLGPR